MLLTTLYRITKTSLVSFWRNWWLSLAATLIMVLTLVTISFFISLLSVTNKTTETIREKADMTVYFNTDTTKDQILGLQSVLLTRSDIKSVDYVSKEKALELWQQRNQGDAKMQNIISEQNNPLPPSLDIKTNDPNDLQTVYNFVSLDDYKPIVWEISYQKNKDIIDKLMRVTTMIERIGYTVSALFVLISILIIYNTIRLAIFTRSAEIEIMKLVGGSDWYIRGPFVVEGIVYGIAGAIVSSIVYFFAYRLTIPAAESYLGLANLNSNYLGLNLTLAIVLQFVAGLALGVLCSVLAVKRFLKNS